MTIAHLGLTVNVKGHNMVGEIWSEGSSRLSCNAAYNNVCQLTYSELE